MSIPRYIGDPLELHAPGREGYPAYHFTVASPELPCGAAWLASCLLELGLPLWKPWGIDDRADWTPLGRGYWRYGFPGSGWSRVVPGLVDGRVLRLLQQPVPQFIHALPGTLPAPERLILFVRHPADALRSAWMRERRTGNPVPQTVDAFADACRAGLQPISRREELIRFLRSWRSMMPKQARIIRFEDAKHRPRGTLLQVLRFVGFRASGRSIAAALAASDHGRVVAAEQRLLQSGAVPTSLVGEGRALAYRAAPAAEQLTIDDTLADLCRWLGYRP